VDLEVTAASRQCNSRTVVVGQRQHLHWNQRRLRVRCLRLRWGVLSSISDVVIQVWATLSFKKNHYWADPICISAKLETKEK